MPMSFGPWTGRLLASWLLGSVVLTTLLWGPASCEEEERELCSVAQDKCVSRMGCGMAMHNYYISCSNVIHAETPGCTPLCKKALVSLLSTEDKGGEAFMKCDCNGVELCQDHKARLDVCSRDVLQAMHNVNNENKDISCSLAEMICRADTSCLTALDYYTRHCGKMFRGEKCTSRCNNSLAILYRQAKAWKLRSCVCDGTEDYDCEKIQNNFRRLCLWHEPRHKIRHMHSGHKHNHNQTAGGTQKPHEGSSEGGSGSSDMGRQGVQQTVIDNNVVNLASGTRVAHISPLTLAALLLFLVTWLVHR